MEEAGMKEKKLNKTLVLHDNSLLFFKNKRRKNERKEIKMKKKSWDRNLSFYRQTFSSLSLTLSFANFSRRYLTFFIHHFTFERLLTKRKNFKRQIC
jgi:hypothetical protein